ncbi:16S rRNA (guanine(527)-N(7))-methyltransferase RsmG [Martelella alba]|uniref:Ribosomal RNA small subunit methyltransferase G n=1 Tax=Martelella alba TaxID=2590451 RepID=A0A506U6P2_9HYPH|nr:16S rRNA (guanine(527)-N(7))-methyltransferase RsmG [Martelella alba]TPW28625.1 16S rRNA (guanine(527)-N(7))-methyltransferase RsmG [Martelella alba]
MKLNGQSVSRETQDRLEHFVVHFQKWAKAINLVAPSTKTHMWERHIADSAQIFQLHPRPCQWVDIGSGGGFPGMITAIFLAEAGQGWVHLVESNNKKASFLRTAIRETGARASVHAIRAEAAMEEIESADCMSARALAALDELFAFAEPWAKKQDGFRCYFHKGRDYQSEIDKARGQWQFDLIEHESRVEPGSVVLEVSNLRRI